MFLKSPARTVSFRTDLLKPSPRNWRAAALLSPKRGVVFRPCASGGIFGRSRGGAVGRGRSPRRISTLPRQQPRRRSSRRPGRPISSGSGGKRLSLRRPGRPSTPSLWGRSALQVARRHAGETSEQLAGWHDWLAPLYAKREDWPAARKARDEVLAIRTRLYGPTDWRVRSARVFADDVKTRAGLTAEQRRALLEVEKGESQLVALQRSGDLKQAIHLAEQQLETNRRILARHT